MIATYLFPLLVYLFGNNSKRVTLEEPVPTNSTSSIVLSKTIDTSFKTIYIYVALCDNKYQGIVPVPAKIGNGQDPNNKLRDCIILA